MNDKAASSDQPSEKRAYAIPELTRLGSIASLTAGGSGPVTEAGMMAVMMRQVRS